MSDIKDWGGAAKQVKIDSRKDIEPVPEQGESVPDEFLFESKIIFISNLADIPEAIGDRTLSIQLNYDKEQALQMIEKKLTELVPEYPDLTIGDKKEILAFMRKHKNVAPRISFRTFIHIAAVWKSNDPNKEKWALIQMKGL